MATTPQQTTTTAVSKKTDVSKLVLNRIESFKQSGELRLPKDYSPENALKSAYLVLSETKNKDGKYALDHCTTESIANSLLKMVVWGVSPLKKQCDLIMYGNTLELVIEYTGNIALAKRYGGLDWIKASSIFEGDEFEFEVDTETGRKKITKHVQTLDSIGSKNLKGAYAVYQLVDGTKDVEIMNINQIKDSWAQGGSNGNSPAHKKFPDQMANKTVINRACKLLIRGSNDSVLYDKEDNDIDVAKSDVTYQVSQEANQDIIDIEAEEVVEQPKKESPEQEDASEKSKQESNPVATTDEKLF